MYIVGVPKPSYVEFRVSEEQRLEMLSAVVSALVDAKATGEWHDDEYWLGFFGEEARVHFWWPTEAELEEYSRRLLATPVEQRASDPSLDTPWDFGSMIDAFRNGDYRLLGLRVDGSVARIEFEPFGWPYGGTDCMEALVEAFGFTVTAREE